MRDEIVTEAVGFLLSVLVGLLVFGLTVLFLGLC